ncbi:hypothetical protein ACFWXK_19725 [Streptomyces sp. NPDC059070]|uniref:hypothetical protein n=1 Tax=unclassified Streptomyces TaxID=2593676 RepID=UPI0034E2B575
MRLRTTITASVLALGVVLGGASSALAHDGGHGHGRHHSSEGGKHSSCHTAMGSSANRGSFLESDCEKESWGHKEHGRY